MADFLYTEFNNKFVSSGKRKQCDLLVLIAEPIENKKGLNKENKLLRPFVDNESRHPQQDQLYSAAVIDIDDTDDNLSVLKSKLSRLKSEMYIYSTWNHLRPGCKNRWRVVIPFKYPRPWSFTKRSIELVCHKAQITPDKTCISEARGFYAPQINPMGKYEHSVVHYGDGYIDQINKAELNPVSKSSSKEIEQRGQEEKKERKKPVKLISTEPAFVKESSSFVVDTYVSFQKLWASQTTQYRLLSYLGVRDYPERESSKGFVSKSFISPLSLYPEEHPSWTALWLDERQEVVLKCHSSVLEHRSVWGVLDIYYANMTNDTSTVLTGPERAVWQMRMMVDAGVIKAAEVPFSSLPDNVSNYVKNIYQGFQRLLEIKWAIKEFSHMATCFSRKFAAKWCGVSVASASRAIRWLQENSFIRDEGVFSTARGLAMTMYLPV